MNAQFDLCPETAFLGDWLDPADVTALIPTLARRYHSRYRKLYIGDVEDLQQSAHLAFWEFQTEQGFPERVRELPALSVITKAVRDEIESTKRTGPLHVPSDEVNWKLLTVKDRNLSEHQRYALDCILMAVSQIVKRPNFEMAWLVLGCGWKPEDVTAWFKVKPNDRHRYLPDEVRRRVGEAARDVRLYLDRSYLDEINTISFPWWQ